ncbi:beta-phosphoglucomutase [Ideonella sp. BN130291]|uniref:beta-phosphoglucomutase n=1 Tax=Ideonella sp. BN130291 TaxID=3112940 RepID=UPI002E259762|nr:beta-phosphoglucomutase [Ideonella sp. BN130291]
MRSDMQRLQAVIFDLDGVITDTAHFHFLAWRELAHSLGLPFDEAFNERLKGIDRMGSLALILAQGHKRYSEPEQQLLAAQKNLHYQRLIETMTADHLLPGALEALVAVRAAGLKIGLASVSKNAAPVLDRLGIADRFDVVVDAARIQRSKPDPEIFLSAAQQLGVAPAACLGVEDAVAGVQAIQAAGMFALGVGDPAVLVQADEVIPGLQAFRLERYLGPPTALACCAPPEGAAPSA